MKLQACSKIITLTALGFTLTAAGAFYSLINAERTIDANYQHELQSTLNAVGADLKHYTQRINSEYYELVNSSLSNILSLEQSVYEKDPLLNFFNHNLRIKSPYSSGENLSYALEALAYFKIPYFTYDFNTQKLELVGLSAEPITIPADNDTEPQATATATATATANANTNANANSVDSVDSEKSDVIDKSESTDVSALSDDVVKEMRRLLRARDQDNIKIADLIANKPTLSQSFSIMYSGTDTYLCLKLYDKVSNKNYIIVDRYLKVLENTDINVKNIFSDIDPMMQSILKDDAVMIVRRDQPIFKTNDFDLSLDFNNRQLRDSIGVRIIDTNGNDVTDATTISNEHQASIMGVSYLRSINAYLVLKRPFELIKSDTSIYTFSKIAIILLSLIFLGMITRIVMRDGQNTKENHDHLSQFVSKVNALTPDNFLEKLKQARTDVLNAKKAEDSASANANTSATNSDSTVDSTNASADTNIEAVSTAPAATSAAAATTAADNIATSASATENTSERKHEQSEAADTSSTSSTRSTSSNSNDAAAASTETSGATKSSEHDAEHEHEHEHEEVGATDEAHDEAVLASAEYGDKIDDALIDAFLQGEEVDRKSPMGQVVAASLKLAHGLEHNFAQQVQELKQEFKSRIPVYRKEGQCIAARQMLLNAMPAEETMPSSNFVDFAAFTVPARDPSGNFYAMERLDDDNLAFVIGDCSSSGPEAAYTVAVITTLVEEALKLDLDPPHVMRYLNERLCALPNTTSVALFIGMISEKTGNVIAANAGHCVPIVVDDTGPHFVAQFNDQRLGVNKDQDFELIKWYLANDDIVVLYSNGILNVNNAKGEIFGMDRLLDHCVGANSMRADELIIKILTDIKQHKGKRPFKEDVSLICLKQLLIRF